MINTLFIHNSDFIKTVFDVYIVYFCLTKIIIEKQDSETEEPLKGAKFEILELNSNKFSNE